MQPEISVIVPVYKVENYLEKCVNSLLAQTYPYMDIVLVDDGSPDDCPVICDRLSAEHANVKVFHKNNGGLSDARNYGVQHTDKDWIVFVDSDDYVEPSYVSTLVNLKNQFNVDFVITRTSRENEDGTGKPSYIPFESCCINKKAALYEVYTGNRVGWAAYGKLYPREVLLKYPFPSGYYEDCACMYKIIDEFDRIAIGDFDSNYHYIQRKGSILGSGLDERHLHIFDICDDFESFIDTHYPDMKNLSVVFRRRAVTQLLNLQKMSYSSFKNVFLRYRDYFRQNRKMVFETTELSKNAKVYYILLCGAPIVYYAQMKIIRKRA